MNDMVYSFVFFFNYKSTHEMSLNFMLNLWRGLPLQMTLVSLSKNEHLQ